MIIFFHGFETVGTDADTAADVIARLEKFFTVHHGDIGNGGGMDLVPSAVQGYALRSATSTFGDGNYIEYALPSPVAPPGPEIIYGFRLKLPDAAATWNVLTVVNQYPSGDFEGQALLIRDCTDIEVWNTDAFSPLVTAADVFSPGQEVYIEFKLKSASTGVVQVRIDGTEVINATPDTENGADIVGKTVRFKAVAPLDVTSPEFDDIYISTGDFLGPVRCARLALTGDAGPNEWTPSAGTDHYAVVEDRGSDYLEASAAAVEAFTHAPDTLGVPVAVQISAEATGDGGTLKLGDSSHTPDGTAKVFTHIFDQEWTETSLNEATFGIEFVE